MANETISTSTNRSAVILAAEVQRLADPASYGKFVMARHCNVDDLTGMRSLAKKYSREDDYGPASAGTQATAPTLTEGTLATPVTLTIAENALSGQAFSYLQMEAELGVSSMEEISQGILVGNPQLVEFFTPAALTGAERVYEKIETDAQALILTLGTEKGTTETELSLEAWMQALLALESTDHGQESQYVYTAPPKQLDSLRRSIALTSGGYAGAVWGSGIGDIVRVIPDEARQGIAGSLFGVPVFRMSASVNPLDNSDADEVGALFVSGFGQPHVDGGRNAAFVMGHKGPIPRVSIFADPKLRIVNVFVSAHYAFAELVDTKGIRLISDAP